MSFLVLVITALVLSIPSANAKPGGRHYRDGDYIPMFANKVRPHNNNCKAYPYFELPFCPPGIGKKKMKKSLDKVLEGDCFINTGYELRFNVVKVEEILCEKNLTRDEVAKFRNAIKSSSQYQMCFNNIPFWGSVGFLNPNSTSKYYLFTDIVFYVYHFRDKVKDVEVLGGAYVDITEDVRIRVNFTYSVVWENMTKSTAYSRDHDGCKYLWPTERPTAWSIAGLPHPILQATTKLSYAEFSSLIERPTELWTNWIVFFIFWATLTSLIVLIYLTNYLGWNSNGDTEEARGPLGLWKIHGDACNCPPYSSLLGAFLGNGFQQLILIYSLFAGVHKGTLNPCNKEELFALIFWLLSTTTSFSGSLATSIQRIYIAAPRWKECVFQAGILYFFPALSFFWMVNVIQNHALGISNIFPFKTALKLGIWGIFSLCLAGKCGHAAAAYVFGRNPQPFCPTSRIPRAAHQQPWYMKTPPQMFLGGLLPFVTIFWGMDNIYASLWNQKICGAFWTLLTYFSRVVIVTALVGAGFTYIQLSKHDNQWWWRSVLRGGSPAIFMFAYSSYFYPRASPGDPINMIYLGYNFCIFYGFFLALGTVGFCASLFVFFCKYRNELKND